jgi:hypothetical protein
MALALVLVLALCPALVLIQVAGTRRCSLAREIEAAIAVAIAREDLLLVEIEAARSATVGLHHSEDVTSSLATTLVVLPLGIECTCLPALGSLAVVHELRVFHPFQVRYMSGIPAFTGAWTLLVLETPSLVSNASALVVGPGKQTRGTILLFQLATQTTFHRVFLATSKSLTSPRRRSHRPLLSGSTEPGEDRLQSGGGCRLVYRYGLRRPRPYCKSHQSLLLTHARKLLQ